MSTIVCHECERSEKIVGICTRCGGFLCEECAVWCPMCQKLFCSVCVRHHICVRERGEHINKHRYPECGEEYVADIHR